MKSILIFTYWIFLLLHVGNGMYSFGLDYWFKPMLMPVLAGYFYLSVDERRGIGFKLILAALFFCWLGDCFLMYQDIGSHYFILGLGSFLLGHIIYSFTYPKLSLPEPVNEPLLITQKLRHGLTIGLAGLALFVILSPHLGALRLPVMIYAAVLVFMTIMALLRYGYTTQKSFGLVFGGAICFMISDSLLAINKFMEPINYSTFWVMVTYCLAQFLIVKGAMEHINTNVKAT